MMKKLILCLLAMMGVLIVAAQGKTHAGIRQNAEEPVTTADFETAAEAVQNMAVGWNLGNTLDSHSCDVANMWIEKWTSRTPTDYETAWEQPVTKPELMQMMKEAGFRLAQQPTRKIASADTFTTCKAEKSSMVNPFSPRASISSMIGK